MKLWFSAALFVIIGAAQIAHSQSPEATPPPVKLVITYNLPGRPRIIAAPSPTPATTEPAIKTVPNGPSPVFDETNMPKVALSFGEIKGKIAEAKRQLQSRPQLTASEDPKL